MEGETAGQRAPGLYTDYNGESGAVSDMQMVRSSDRAVTLACSVQSELLQMFSVVFACLKQDSYHLDWCEGQL